YQVWHSSQIAQGGSNHISYSNAELDRLIEEMRSEFDSAKRRELAHKIGEIIHRDQPYTFLVWPYSLVAVSEKFKNLNVYPAGMEITPAYL
ncbi:MAG: peptide-binding protein, partial [Lentisphaeria bacterium]|nr:peptide-binding protein [Lentisphaeria bacterium]